MPSSIGLPLSSSLPGPTATTLPFVGFSLAVSGRRMPLLVFSSASDCFTITRSARGRSLVAMLGLTLVGHALACRRAFENLAARKSVPYGRRRLAHGHIM